MNSKLLRKMAQMPSNLVAVLALRSLKFIFLVVALGVLVSDTLYVTQIIDYDIDYSFDDVYAYRYLLSTIVIGMLFALLQIVFSIYCFHTGIKIYGVSIFQFNFYADKVISYLLGTGAAAGFAVTNEMKHLLSIGEDIYEDSESSIGKDIVFNPFYKFFDQAVAATACVFLAFVISALLSILSTWALMSNEPKAQPKPKTDTEAQEDLKALPEPEPKPEPKPKPEPETAIARVQD